MFIGHFGVGFAAKKLAPGISLAVLFIAAQFLDLLWPNLLLLGLEEVAIEPGITVVTPLDFIHYPISHSLLMVAIWAALCGLVTWMITKKQAYALVIFTCVLSHWFLDLLVHRPDLPATPWGESRFGLGFWNYAWLTIVLEAVFFFGGVYLYIRSTAAKNNFGRYGLMALILLFVVIELSNLFGPPPPDVATIAWASQFQWLFVIIAYFVDRNRVFNEVN
ncbi:MAG: metal-dependent hydrolase [Vicingaceae bacterium]